MGRQDLPHLILLNMECYDVCELVSNKHKCNSVVPPQEARVLQALLVRREAIAQDFNASAITRRKPVQQTHQR